MAERFLAVTESAPEPNESRLGHRLIGISLHFLGDQTRAGEHLDRMIGSDTAPPSSNHIIRFQIDPWLTARVFQARIRWLQGFPDDATRIVTTTIKQALSLGHELTLITSLVQGACLVSLFNGDLDSAQAYAALVEEHCTRQDITLGQAWGRCFSGAVLVKRGEVAAGLRLMQAQFADHGARRLSPQYMVLLGELASAHGVNGEYQEALKAISEVLERAERNEERWYLPELMCIKGRILLLEGSAGAENAAEGHFLQAITCARQQQVLSLELRAVTALARLRASTGQAEQARAELLPVFERFTEGFSTADLREAKALLDQLS